MVNNTLYRCHLDSPLSLLHSQSETDKMIALIPKLIAEGNTIINIKCTIFDIGIININIVDKMTILIQLCPDFDTICLYLDLNFWRLYLDLLNFWREAHPKSAQMILIYKN